MIFSQSLHSRASLRIAALGLALLTSTSAQTFSSCNPTTGATCPANPALGRSATINLASGAGSDFTALGSTTFGGDGATFSVAQSGAAPQINSKWYIMFGRVEVTMQAAPGAGIVSSIVLQSDALDEIDWEFLGSKPGEVQTNYFGKGYVGASDRGQTHAVSGTQTGFHTYSVDWTADQVIWQVDGATVRVLKYAEANGQFPQTPMQVKIGSWAGGDAALNPPGTVQWAGGPTNFAAGPFNMIVKSVSVADYSTGTSYSYGSSAGTWQSIKSNGGTISGQSNGAGFALGSSASSAVAPAITSSSVSTGSQPPWSGTHRSVTTIDPATNTNFPGLPDGWTVTSSGKVVPPSSASPVSKLLEIPPRTKTLSWDRLTLTHLSKQTPSPTPPPSSSPLSSASPSPLATTASPPSSVSPAPVAAQTSAPAACETLRGFDIQGMPTSVLVAPGGKISYDQTGNAVGSPACSNGGARAGAAAKLRRDAGGVVTLLRRW